MQSLFILSAMVALFIAYALLEYRRHQERVYALPHRIHVNGTRGKSSVTRLIGAGLRAGGVSTITKVTGTFPRLILPDGTDIPVHRKSIPSILEQLKIVDFARRQKAEALVIECMALVPEYQRITEHQMVHATLGVMTNIRLDHTDVMGRTLDAVGESMANTMPPGRRLLTGENENLDLMRRLARERDVDLVETDAQSIQAEDLEGFPYIEHKENVALALAVCAELGVERSQALKGMWEAEPDAGVLTRAKVEDGDKTATLFNAFAANDPDSSLKIWNMLKDLGHLRGKRFILLNSRADRKERSEQLAELVAGHLDPELDGVFVMGEPTDAVVRLLRSLGMHEEKIFDLGFAEPEQVYDAILTQSDPESSVVAIGNMGGFGAATVDYFDQRSRNDHG